MEGFDVWGWRHRRLQLPQVRFLFFIFLYSTKFYFFTRLRVQTNEWMATTIKSNMRTANRDSMEGFDVWSWRRLQLQPPQYVFFFTLLIFFLLDYLIERANGHLNRHTQLTRHVYYNLTSNSSNHVNNDDWARRRVWRWGWRRLQVHFFFFFLLYTLINFYFFTRLRVQTNELPPSPSLSSPCVFYHIQQFHHFNYDRWGLMEGFDVWSASPVPTGTFVFFFFLFSTKFWFFLLDYVYENFI